MVWPIGICELKISANTTYVRIDCAIPIMVCT
jgi:hypothetical protein